jgi:hypothetical protein
MDSTNKNFLKKKALKWGLYESRSFSRILGGGLRGSIERIPHSEHSFKRQVKLLLYYDNQLMKNIIADFVAMKVLLSK